MSRRIKEIGGFIMELLGHQVQGKTEIELLRGLIPGLTSFDTLIADSDISKGVQWNFLVSSIREYQHNRTPRSCMKGV